MVGFASKVGAAGEVAYEAPDVPLALLASISNSQSFDEAPMLDPARLEANIVNQLYLGASVFMEDVSVSPLLRGSPGEELVISSGFFSFCFVLPRYGASTFFLVQ